MRVTQLLMLRFKNLKPVSGLIVERTHHSNEFVALDVGLVLDVSRQLFLPPNAHTHAPTRKQSLFLREAIHLKRFKILK